MTWPRGVPCRGYPTLVTPPILTWPGGVYPARSSRGGTLLGRVPYLGTPLAGYPPGWTWQGTPWLDMAGYPPTWTWQGTPLSWLDLTGYPPGWTCQGTPPQCLDLAGYPPCLDLAGYPPGWTWQGNPPPSWTWQGTTPVSAPWHSGKSCKALWDMGTPLGVDWQTKWNYYLPVVLRTRVVIINNYLSGIYPVNFWTVLETKNNDNVLFPMHLSFFIILI